jgi:hypothetical protein
MASYSIPIVKKGNAKMMYLVQQYRAEHPDAGENILPHLISDWAIAKGLWHRPPMDARDILRRLISRALRNEHIEDEKGREVRKYHAVLEEVRTSEGIQRRPKWLEIHEAPAEHMRISFSLRRRAALADVVQLEFDYEYWNSHNRFGESLPPLEYNFTPDVDEAKQPTRYPNEPPEREDDEDDDGIV